MNWERKSALLHTREFSLGRSQRRQDPSHSHTGRSLDIIVEGTILSTILFQKPEGLQKYTHYIPSAVIHSGTLTL